MTDNGSSFNHPFYYDGAVQPFDSAEEAWFWFIQAYEARCDGARFAAGQGLTQRPCEPLDILKVVDRLYRQRRLIRDHLKILKHYGDRKMAPDPFRPKEVRAACLWNEAMERIEPILLRKGIVRRRDQEPNLNWVQDAMIFNTIKKEQGYHG